MRRDKKNNSIFKCVKVKAITPERRLPIKTIKPPQGQFFTEDGVDEVLMQVTDWLDKFYPHLDFRMVQTGVNSFSFIGEFKSEQIKHSETDTGTSGVVLPGEPIVLPTEL